jgi:hypothetical protein
VLLPYDFGEVLRTVLTRQNLIAHDVEARLYVMPELRRRSRAPDASTWRSSKIPKERPAFSPTGTRVLYRYLPSLGVFSSPSNEALAEKILSRVGFFVGFLAQGGRACN